MNKTRRLVRLHLLMLLIVLLPFAGFLWTVPNHHVYVGLIGFICLVLAISMESIVQQMERETTSLQLKADETAEVIADYKEKVREIERLLTISTQENENYRRDELDRQIHGIATSAPVPG